MTEASTKILELIENVSPDNSGELDEIDFCVSEYLGNKDTETERRQGYAWKSYARSRDALKSIRPEGWKFNIKYDWVIDRYVCTGCSDYKKPDNINTQYAKVCSPYLENITEELAELHAIIQAKAYERNQNE